MEVREKELIPGRSCGSSMPGKCGRVWRVCNPGSSCLSGCHMGKPSRSFIDQRHPLMLCLINQFTWHLDPTPPSRTTTCPFTPARASTLPPRQDLPIPSPPLCQHLPGPPCLPREEQAREDGFRDPVSSRLGYADHGGSGGYEGLFGEIRDTALGSLGGKPIL